MHFCNHAQGIHTVKELGLVETISIANPLFGCKANSINGINSLWTQQFDYLIVIDFESTCWEGEQGGWKQPEIIEFPAVLLNVHTGQLEQEFQQYVCPIENQKLSEFCKSLTGITQQQVDDGVPLSTCLLLFSRWINTIKQNTNMIFHGNSTQKSENERLCTFVTWSDWDLATCLHNECRRKQISKLDILNQWVDLRATYKQLYNRRPQGLRGALSELGINFEGREHSGLCDARNTAHLAWRMVQDGGVLKITTNINTTSARYGSSLFEHPFPQHLPSFREAPNNNCAQGAKGLTMTKIAKLPQTAENIRKVYREAGLPPPIL
uniref:Exonuclease domain-containing protein n=1 Tax=Timema genevievae TaxID=629358 RepID=A0A7R9K027_TIMGE|nr:unnamed protein product [Timema genevievae]